MVRRQRRWVAGLMMLGVVFAQIVTVAHACTLALAASQPVTAFVEPTNDAMEQGCLGMAKCGAASANANACESHCIYGQQIDVQPAIPLAAFAPQPGLIVRAVPPIEQPSLDAIFLRAKTTAPPVSLLFGRFLA